MGPRAVALAVELSVAWAKGWPTERFERELRALTRTILLSRPGRGGRSVVPERFTLQPANGKEGEIEHEGR